PGPPPNINDACEFTAITESLPLTPGATYSDGGTPVVANCKVTLTILMWDDGSSKVKEVEIEAATEGPTPQVPCAGISTSVDPEDDGTWWDNQICEDETSNPSQYWERVEIAFAVGSTPIAGPVFVLLDLNPLNGEARG